MAQLLTVHAQNVGPFERPEVGKLRPCEQVVDKPGPPVGTGVAEKSPRFVRRGKRLSYSYLFSNALEEVCQVAGLMTPDSHPTITPHRFRHTVGTQLAERGARTRTIMNILGHSTASMSMIYAHISDKEVLHDYQAVLGPGASIAGPYAESLREGRLSQQDLDWLQTNFFKTELELGLELTRFWRVPKCGDSGGEVHQK